jgi:hypothetical protein
MVQMLSGTVAKPASGFFQKARILKPELFPEFRTLAW